jgi:hypothetical protein
MAAAVGGVLVEDLMREQFGDDAASPASSSSA